MINTIMREILDMRIKWNIAIIDEMVENRKNLNDKLFNATVLVARLQNRLDKLNIERIKEWKS